MTSSTTRAFMAKKPFATASAFMAKTNQLLSTMASLRLLLVMFLTLTVTTNAWAEEYEKYSGTITEGDYLIVYSNGAMQNTVSSDRLQYSDVTVSNNKISNPDASLIWHIAPNGSYWTIYNAKVSKYAAGTKVKNKAQLLTSGTDERSLWTVSGTSTYEFVNKANKAASVNSNLRRNGTYGFACYATGTGGALTLYKKVAAVQTVAVTGVSLNKTSLTLTEGSSETLSASVSPDNATDKTVTWTTNKSSVATVSDGKVTAVAEGSATITVTTNDGNKTATCTVTVTPKPKYTVTLVPGSGSVTDTELEEPNAGDGVTLPTPTLDCGDWKFAGWKTTSAVTTETTTEPTLIAAGAYSPTSDITLYAVYQRTETTSGGGGGESHSITITPNTFTDKGSNNYGSGAERIGSENAVSFGGHYITGNIKNTPSGATAGTYLQCQANNATIYNKTELPGKITKIVVNQHDARAFSLYCGKEQLVASNNTNTGVTPSGTKITDISSATTMTWNVDDGYTFFALKKGSNAGYITSIVITYQTDGGQSETTYYHSTPECNTETSYSVTYETNGGETTCEDNTKYEEGADVMLCGEIPTKENYVFNGWSSTPSVTVTDGKFKMPKSDVTFTAQWSECTGPRITAFNRNGTTDGTYNLGANLGTLSVTAKPSNGGNLIYCWYQYDDATTINQAKPAAGTYNEATYQIPNNEPCIARHYYCIVSEEGCDKTQKSDISGALTLNAIQHTITWSVNGTTQSLSPFSVTDGNNLGTLPTPNLDGICEGKTFVGWTTEANKNYSHETTAPSLITEDTKPNGDVTYYAVFATPEDGAKKTIIFANEWNDTQDLSEHSYFDNAITLSFAKNEGTTAPKYYTSSAAIRLYYRNTMTVTTTAPMQSITFTFVTEVAKGNSISTNPDFGTLSKTPTNQSTESLTHTWNVNTTSVTFTIGKDQNSSESGHCKISQIDVVTGDGDAVTYSNYTTSCTTTYTVTYNGNGNTGGTVPTDNNKYEENAQVTVLGNTSNLVKEGYTFAGWNTQSDGNGTDYAAGATFEITKNTTLYAKWEANTYTVCFNANGGTGTMENQSFTYGAEQALSSNKFTRDSYVFAGWATTADGAVVYTDAQSVSNLTTTNGATVTLYAQWSELYTVTFYNMGSVYTTKTQESVGGSITSPEAPSACEGYTFDGWSATEVDGVPSYEAVTTITPNEDTQLYAVYSKSEDGGGNATVEDKLTRETTGVSDQTGTTVSYTDWSEIKSQSNAIYKGNSAGNYNSIQLRSDKSTSGVITTTSGGKAKKVTVEWNSNTASGRTLNVYGKNSAYSAATDLYDNSKQGTKLGSIVKGTSTELTISGDYEYIGLRSSENAMYFTSITITWATGGPSTTYTTSPDCAEVYNITIDSNIEHGFVTASPMSAVAGTTISLTATPDDTYKFDSWQVTDENSNTIDVTTENTFIMPETDVTVSAIFTEKKRYTITWYANGSEYTTTDVIEDIQIAPPALPNMENYCGVFAGWTTESPVSGNFDEAPTLYNEQSEFPLATEETPKTFYAVFADVEGIIPELPKTIAYWEKQQITTESDMSATIGTGIMTSNVNLSTESNRTYQSTINTEATITLSGLNLTSYDDITLTFWARGSAKGDITITTDLSNEVIRTVTLTGTEVLYKINNIPSTATSITLTYSANSGSFFFGTVKLLETPAVYSFEKITAENTNGWTGSDWDGYYLITNGQSTLLALDGNAILDGSYEKVEEQNDVIEVPITMAFCVTYDATKSGYSLQGVGDGMFLISKGNDGKEIGAAEKENAAYFPTIGYNQLTTSSNMELSWNTSGDLLRFYNPPKEAPQMYKIMSELSNYRTLCTYDIVLKNNYVDDDSKDGLATITATKTTFNTFTPPTQRPGYIIEGYYAEPQCTKKVVEANQTLITNVDEYTQNGQWIGGNVELYTKWQPLIYNLQSGNFSDWGTCGGGNLTLDGSAIGVKYQLYKDDVKYGEEISGTGMALTWEITESGSYTVKSVDPEMLMNGKAVVQLQDPTIVGENTVEVGKTITLTHPGHRDAAGSWVSSNPEIARVDNNTVTGVAAGIVTITFHGLGNCDATHEVTVVNPEYTMTWKIDEGDYATTTVQAGKTIAALPTNPLDNALGCCSDKFMGWTTSIAQTINKADVFTTLAEAQAKFPNITEDKTFYAVFATTAQGVGTSIADFSEMGYENGTTVTDPIVVGDGEGHGDATITLAKAQSSSKAPTYYTDGGAVRIYAGGTITIASTYNNATIKNIVFTFAGNDVVGENTITASSGTYDNGTWTGNANTVTFTIAGSTGHRRIASITVTTGVTGSQYTNYVTQCTVLQNPTLSGGSVPAIAVNCGDFSTLSNSQAIVFSTMQDLTCPVTFEVIEGDFLISTARDRAAQYQSKVKVLPYKTGENLGKLKNVYVRANATDHNENFTGKIKVTSDEIADDVIIIDLTANVTCEAFTLTINNHLGTETVVGNYFAGDVITAEPTPSSDACTAGYTFDGWSTTEVKYGSLIYNKVSFPYTMPNHDVILYPVYRINDTEDYHRVTSDLGANNWAGDYLIAYSDQIFADGRIGGKTNENSIGRANVRSEDFSEYIKNNVVPASYGNTYYITLESVSGGYLLKTQDGKYNYHTNNSDNDLSASESASTAGKYTINVEFISDSDIRLCLSGNALGSVFRYGCGQSGCFFRFYKDCGGKSIYLYKKSTLYTTSLICGTIEIQENDIVVTSTKDQSIKVSVPVKLTSSYNDAVAITGANVNAFSVITKENVPVNTEEVVNVELVYSPQAYDQLDTETITLTATNGATTSFQVTGRSLPETFAIVAKVGNVWYALPSQGLNSETTPVGYPVKVDNNDNPTAVTSLPITAEWSLRNVYKVNGQNDRFTANGENLVFVNTENKTLYANNGNANIQTYAEYTNYATTNPERYEWVPTTTDLTNYTLKNVGRDKDLSINVNATFGTHASNIASNNLRFLPINATYNPFDMQVVEWYPTKVLVQTEAVLTSVSAIVGGIAVANPVVTKKGGKLYEISGLPLESNPTKILTISYDTYSCSKVIPIIISRATKSVTDAPFTTLTTSVYNYSDLVVRDGATLTINGTKQAPDKFVNVTIYPTAKIVVPENKQLSVYSLTFFGGISEIYNGSTYDINKYGVPQLSLKGTLGKTVTTMDYIMRVNLEQMYQVGVPYDVNLNEITYWDGASIALGTALYVSAYDGAARAQLDWDKTWQWEVNFAEKVLKAGIGYTISAEPQVAGDTYSILRMPMKNNINSGNTETQKATINVTAHGMSDENLTDNHKGWNYLSNPYMTSISGAESGGVDNNNIVVGYLVETGKGPWEWKNDTYRYVTIPYDDGTNYYQRKFSEATLLPFKSFFLQIANSGDLSFALASRLNAPMRHLQQQENAPREVEVELLLSNDAQSDNTGLLISEEFTPAYEINADLEKMTGTMSVYTIYNGYQLAYNALSPLNAMEEIPLGYVVPATGEYTFNLDERGDLDDIEHIYLLDHDSSITTDLMEDIYTFTATEKKNDHRFAISVILKAEEEEETPTHLETLEWESDHPYKFIYQDKMYILRNGVIYDAMGKQVQTINK